LTALDVATEANDLDAPEYKLHALYGSLEGHWSVWVNGNWRITFTFEGADVILVDYLGYH
jgi:proteic killer suppression protein